MIPPSTPDTTGSSVGLFDDEAIIIALTKFSTGPEISVVLAQAILHTWGANEGVRSRTALGIAMYFENQDEWTRVLEDQWNRIGLGLPFSPRLREASSSFFTACATRARVWGPSIALHNATRALQPTEALKQARLRHLAWVATFPNKDPVEVRSGRYERLPQTAKPSKMKPELPGFSFQEAFMVQVAVEAKAFFSHHSILLHQAGRGFS